MRQIGLAVAGIVLSGVVVSARGREVKGNMDNVPPPIDLLVPATHSAVKRIALVTLAFVVVGPRVRDVRAEVVQSTVTLVPAKQQKGGVSSIVGGDLGALATGSRAPSAGARRSRASPQCSRVPPSLTPSSPSSASRRGTDSITRFQHARRCGRTARRSLRRSSLVELTCEDKDPKVVQEMLSFFADYGNQVFRRVGVSSASEEVRFLEKHVAELRDAADDASARVLAFEQGHGIVDLDTQSKAVVSALATLEWTADQ